jgi:hypothetical protein
MSTRTPVYPVVVDRRETNLIIAWLVDAEVCTTRAEAVRTLLGPDRSLAVEAYRQYGRPADEETPACLADSEE